LGLKARPKEALRYKYFPTLANIPPEAFEYKLGNRSALEWIIDRYQIHKDKRSGIVNDPNRADDREYIVKLIGKVITVSIETMNVVKGLPHI
jgi:predicted helicase